MKVKDLIKVLQAVDPEKYVTLSLGNNDEYRAQCAKAELGVGDCLGYLSVDSAVIRGYASDSLWCDIIVQQDNICDLEAAEDKFNEKYEAINHRQHEQA